MREDQAVYLDDTGHMSGVDSLLGLDRAVRDGRVARRRRRAAAVGRHRLHVGRDGRALGRGRVNAGETFGPSSWIEIPQEKIDAFADATGDHQWIHVDPERAQEGPFGTTIGHGYLTLSLLPGRLVRGRSRARARMGINYGLNRVRFPAPVPVGSRLRASFEVVGVDEIDGGAQVTMSATVEREGGDKPVCVAEVVFRYYD